MAELGCVFEQRKIENAEPRVEVEEDKEEDSHLKTKTVWTLYDDHKILAGVFRYGTKWALIKETYFANEEERYPDAIRNRFRSIVRKVVV